MPLLDPNDPLLQAQRIQPIRPVLDRAGMQPTLNDPLAPAKSAVDASRATGSFDQTGSTLIRQPSAADQAFQRGGIAGLLNAPTGQTPQIALSAPGQRAAGVQTPNTTTAAAPSTEPGAMDQYGNRAPNAPATVTPNVDLETAASNKLGRALPNGNIESLSSRGSAGVRALASDPNAQGAFNDLQGVRGNGISASTDANGQLVLSGNGANATKPQNFTAGFDLAGSNARQAAALEANNARDTQGQIADLRKQMAYDTNQNPGRQAALQGQIAALSGLSAADARSGLEKAQTGLTAAQTTGTQQANALSAAQQQQVSALQKQFVGETDPQKSKALGDKLLTLLGKDPKQGQFQIAIQEEPIDPNNPFAGTKKVPYLIDTRGGPDGKPMAQRVDEAANLGVGTKAAKVPAGYSQVGTKDGKPVYADKDGKRFIGA